MNQSTGSLLRILLYHFRGLYVRNYLKRGAESEFLASVRSEQWNTDLQQFESYAETMDSKARAAHVPLVVTFLPNRAQAAMLSASTWPAGSDPYRIRDELRGIVARHNGVFLDVVPAFRDVLNAEDYFYPIDGHPNAEGHALLARMLADALTQGANVEFRAPAGAQKSEK